jgi:CBS domain containing-hemolysin-like protein
MLEWTLIRGIMVAFFILANSFFVAAEFALVSIRETRVQQLIALGRPGARTVLQLKRSMDDFLPAVQFGVTLAALALGWIGEPALAEIFSSIASRILPSLPPHWAVYANAASIAISFALITYFEVLLGELVPKSLALQRGERIALAVAGPMDVFIRITRPAVRLMNGSAALVLRLFKAPLHGEGAVHSPEELKLIATATRRMGLLPAFQAEVIHRAIELSHVVVREIMTPRGNIFALPLTMSLEHASARIVDEGHTRVPVYDPAQGTEHIVGIVHSKDVARLMHFRAARLAFQAETGAGGGPRESGLTLAALKRDVLFVPETKLAVDLLQEFQERRRQIAIVVDEFGSTVGLVTAEDALEQIVGELRDEFDEAEAIAQVRMATANSSPGPLLLEGSTTLRDLSTQLGWEFPKRPGVETLAGFLLAELGHIPVLGERVVRQGRVFTVAEMAGRRVSRVRVSAESAAAEAQPAATEDDGLEVPA